jgi:hypothetical protein
VGIVSADGMARFKGFLLQARLVSHNTDQRNAVGEWRLIDSNPNVKTINCFNSPNVSLFIIQF